MKGILKNKKIKRWVMIIGFIGIAIVGITYFRGVSDTRLDAEEQYILSPVEERDITVILSGTGTLKPADAYNVISVVSGDIVLSPFEEGDVVEKDNILFEVDSSAVASSIETAEISLTESQRAYARQLEQLDHLSIKSSIEGTLVEMMIEVGDEIQVGQVVARVQSIDEMLIKIPFLTQDAQTLNEGQEATFTLTQSFEQLIGKVDQIGAIEQTDASGRRFTLVTFVVTNPGGLTNTHQATVKVAGLAGMDQGTFYNKEEAVIVAKTSGEVKTVAYKVGDKVNKDNMIATIESDTLVDGIVSSENAVRRSEISLESQRDTLENYNILSPIGGTVIEKYFKEGDTLTAGQVMATIFDLSYLTMTLNIDELDISKIQVGQMVSLTADAVSGKTYRGTVTRININGSTVGGTTTYPVTVQISETEGLLPGMNVDAKIEVQSKNNVMTIPTEAVLRGSRVLVALKEGETTEDTSAPEGYKYLSIKTGISDTDYIEVIEGLSLGDEVAIEKRVVNTFSFPTGPPDDPDTSFEEVDIP